MSSARRSKSRLRRSPRPIWRRRTRSSRATKRALPTGRPSGNWVGLELIELLPDTPAPTSVAAGASLLGHILAALYQTGAHSGNPGRDAETPAEGRQTRHAG